MLSIKLWPVWPLAGIVGYFLGPRYGFLAVYLLLAVVYDWTTRKIPNPLVLLGALTALACQSWLTDGSGLIVGLGGFGLGFVLLLPLYMLKAMGAGDVKLMAMVGAFVGTGQIIGAVLGTLLTGFFLALAFACKNHAIKQLLINIKLMIMGGLIKISTTALPKMEQPVASIGKMPYALAIAIGTLAYLCLPYTQSWLH